MRSRTAGVIALLFVVLLYIRELKKVENDVDIGIIPAHGIVPPKLPDLDSSMMERGLKNYRFPFPAVQQEASRCDISQQDDNQVKSEVKETKYSCLFSF